MADRSSATASGRPYLSKVSVGVGAAANANIAVTGIRRGIDIVDAVIFHPKVAEPIPSDLTAEVSITSDGNVQLSSTATTNGRVLIYWRKRQP